MEEGTEEVVVVEVTKGELLLKDVCCLFKKESEREAVSKVCGYEEGKANAVDSVVKKGRVEL